MILNESRKKIIWDETVALVRILFAAVFVAFVISLFPYDGFKIIGKSLVGNSDFIDLMEITMTVYVVSIVIFAGLIEVKYFYLKYVLIPSG